MTTIKTATKTPTGAKLKFTALDGTAVDAKTMKVGTKVLMTVRGETTVFPVGATRTAEEKTAFRAKREVRKAAKLAGYKGMTKPARRAMAVQKRLSRNLAMKGNQVVKFKASAWEMSQAATVPASAPTPASKPIITPVPPTTPTT